MQTQTNLIAAARAAWADWKDAEADQLERILLIGRAMLEVRRELMPRLGIALPTGSRYSAAVAAWREANGFGDMDAGFCADVTWLAENEEEVRAWYAKACAARGKSRPSAHPCTLRRAVITGRSRPPVKRNAPTDQPGFLVQRLRKLLDGMPPAERFALIEELTEVIEAAIRQADDDMSAEVIEEDTATRIA